jgi:hypothetical protein
VEVGAERAPDGVLQAGVVHDVEEVLQGPGQVPQVGRAADDVAVGLEHVGGGGGQRRSHHHLHPLDLRVARPLAHRLQQGVEVGRGGVVDDQQAGHGPIMSASVPAAPPGPLRPTDEVDDHHDEQDDDEQANDADFHG